MCLFFVFLLTRAKAVYICFSSSSRELGGLEIIFLIVHFLLNCNSPGSVITDVWPNEKT